MEAQLKGAFTMSLAERLQMVSRVQVPLARSPE
jgi:hypothetical protein